MNEKTITVNIHEQGNSTLDLNGFSGQGCEKVYDDFRGGDIVKVERKKPSFSRASTFNKRRPNAEGGLSCCFTR